GVPTERVAALRAAFAATVKDPEFLAAAAQENMEIRPMTGEKLQDIIVGLLGAPQDVRERMKIALQPMDELRSRRNKPNCCDRAPGWSAARPRVAWHRPS